MLKKMELLAPAGNFSALCAAVSAGANAVYLGLDSFNARRGADNFTLKTLRDACDYAHLRNVKVYLAFNTIVFQREVSRALETMRQAYRAGVDAFIVQDIGIASELKRTLPQARLHISTQMNTHSLAGVHAAHALGASRITLAREMSLEQIELLSAEAEKWGMETEVFGHGALCVCYSGQCYMSSMVGGRSANRGTCAQPCRLTYELKNAAQRKPLASPGDHLLSPKDLCTIDMLDALTNAQVSSLKIEGRMKSPEYVYAVTSVYRAVLDRLYKTQEQLHVQTSSEHTQAQPECVQTLPEHTQTITDWHATEEERNVLAEAFSRGFATAYITHQRGNDIMSYQRPNNRGVFLGRVSRVTKDSAFIQTEKALNTGDVLEIWNKKGRSLFTVSDCTPLKDSSIRLPFQKGDKTTQYIKQGDRVFRVRNAAAFFEADELEPRIPVAIECTLSLGCLAEMSVCACGYHNETGEPLCVHVTGNVVEKARTKPVTQQEIKEHIDRLGQTPFLAKELSVHVDDGVGIGFSQIHKLRAQALEELQQLILAPTQDRQLPRIEKQEACAPAPLTGYAIYVRTTNPACARVAKRTGAQAIYVPALTYKRGQAIVAGQRSTTAEQAGYPKQCIVQLPVVDADPLPSTREAQRNIEPWEYVKQNKPVLVENWGDVYQALEHGAQVEVGSHVPVVNSLALETLARQGVSRVWLSPELTLEQIQDLGKNRSAVPLGVTIMGRTELMTTEHCLLMSQGECAENCEECPRRKSPHFLLDRKGFEFPVVSDACGRSYVYNSVDFDIAHALPDLIAAGVTAFMVDATCMNVEETAHAVGRAVRALQIARHDGNRVAKISGTTTGHLFRAVE